MTSVHASTDPAQPDARPQPDRPTVIAAAGLTKTYTFHDQGAGLAGAVRSLVRRRYQTRLAVDSIDFTIGRGEVVGLLGPNGAGKTTTLKMLSGLLYPTSGELEILGHTPSRRRPDYLRRIALVMGQKTMLWWDVPAMESLLLHKEMYDLSTAEFERNVDELAELLEVRDLLNVQVRKVSLGERMKLELMAALVHRPEILFLDEPTIGLDVVAKARVRAFLAEVTRRHGTTILVTSHDMDDIEALCSRVMVIDHGRLQYDGSLSGLVHAARPRKLVRATYARPVDASALAGLADLDGVAVGSDGSDQTVSLEVERERTGEVLEQLTRLGPLVDLDVADADVEEIMRDLFLRRGTVGTVGTEQVR
ncbi:ABC-2 type transport system ATP-binding protein [Actinopolymorpha cephalotaxi]|uniref:ABC-2 type transport system ATP-binding protein n=1 Tax=Actinopolymorpha cephalotaxi TaxID=504797 RepID=A0A1I2XBL2_9ACTN|nr:ATP-binding cassette domain-containing protein [Actinopolymorpha cephalotaxi]NYH86166.1 ABC-2 type transport system ATP-binding protein [Actinopolymorpha cephalotaxi]SFH10910.1 ABC-2 type transport system ATP-binding protein [Actinopolymorpha cephalotaxi]